MSTYYLKQSLWKQFGASIDMLRHAISLWPEESWDKNRKFFYTAYHCLVFLDYYLSIPPADFIAFLPFTLTEADQLPADAIDDILPNRLYSKTELLDYLQASREKCRGVIAELTEEKLQERWINGESNIDLALSSSAALQFSVLDILLFNLRHVQHHDAQLNMLLRQMFNIAPDYVSSAKDGL